MKVESSTAFPNPESPTGILSYLTLSGLAVFFRITNHESRTTIHGFYEPRTPGLRRQEAAPTIWSFTRFFLIPQPLAPASPTSVSRLTSHGSRFFFSLIPDLRLSDPRSTNHDPRPFRSPNHDPRTTAFPIPGFSDSRITNHDPRSPGLRRQEAAPTIWSFTRFFLIPQPLAPDPPTSVSRLTSHGSRFFFSLTSDP